MPSKKYIPTPVEAFVFNPKNTAELEKLGLTFNDDKTRVTGPTGNELDINEGDYVGFVQNTNDIRVYNKDYFESHYTEFK